MPHLQDPQDLPQDLPSPAAKPFQEQRQGPIQATSTLESFSNCLQPSSLQCFMVALLPTNFGSFRTYFPPMGCGRAQCKRTFRGTPLWLGRKRLRQLTPWILIRVNRCQSCGIQAASFDRVCWGTKYIYTLKKPAVTLCCCVVLSLNQFFFYLIEVMRILYIVICQNVTLLQPIPLWLKVFFYPPFKNDTRSAQWTLFAPSRVRRPRFCRCGLEFCSEACFVSAWHAQHQLLGCWGVGGCKKANLGSWIRRGL